MKIADRLAADLRMALDAEHVTVEDESARHRVHALALRTYTPEEWKQAQS
jgi:stress-induced morphogen